MKPWRVILAIVVMVISVARLASTCSKQEARKKQNAFVDAVNIIETERAQIILSDSEDPESIDRMTAQARVFGKSLDSTIKYYRDNYMSDEARYDQYLELLYEYKKISYTYFTWFAYLKNNVGIKNLSVEYEVKRREFYGSLQSQLLKVRQKAIFY